MRHRKAGRRLDRHSQERTALFRNLTMSLFERFGTKHEFVLTSVAKAKEVRGFCERIVTLGMKARRELDAAAKLAGLGSAEDLRKQHVESEKNFAESMKDKPEETRKRFNEHLSRSLHYRRMVLERLGSTTTPKHRSFEFRDAAPRHLRAVAVLMDKIAPRFIARAEENPKNAGGYTRVLKTARGVKGDGSTRALWGFVGGPGPQAQAPEGEANAEAKAPAEKKVEKKAKAASGLR
jgi:ribosomal protein L17